MLTISNLSKSFDSGWILQGINFSLNHGERLGLIGPNGCGKTTLLRIVAGLETPDSGAITSSQNDLQTGYLPQGLALSPDFSLPGETLHSFLTRGHGDPARLAVHLESLAQELAAHPRNPLAQQAYDSTLIQLETAAASAERIPATLAALGLDHIPETTPLAHLSGGQKTRLALAGVLLAGPRLLLLDEPTNHLDLDMLEWLENWLLAFRGAALIVSHDRAFLDRVATGILEINPNTHNLRAYPGNYTAYLEGKLAEIDRQWQEYTDQQQEISRLAHSAAVVRGVARFKKGGKGDSGDKFAKGFFANRTKGTIARAKHLERRLEYLQTEGRIDKPQKDWQMKLEFGASTPGGRSVLGLENCAVGYDGQALLSDLNLQVRYGERIAIVGPNGTGKTTLLRAIAGRLPPVAGRLQLGANVRPGYMAQEQEDLDPGSDAFTTIRSLAPLSETEARAFLHQFLFSGDAVFTPVARLSYGERARLSLACLVGRGCNLLLLDEPVNHLDIPSRARFEQALAGFEGTVLAVSHDRYFIDGFASLVWELVPGENIYTIRVLYP